MGAHTDVRTSNQTDRNVCVCLAQSCKYSTVHVLLARMGSLVLLIQCQWNSRSTSGMIADGAATRTYGTSFEMLKK